MPVGLGTFQAEFLPGTQAGYEALVSELNTGSSGPTATPIPSSAPPSSGGTPYPANSWPVSVPQSGDLFLTLHGAILDVGGAGASGVASTLEQAGWTPTAIDATLGYFVPCEVIPNLPAGYTYASEFHFLLQIFMRTETPSTADLNACSWLDVNLKGIIPYGSPAVYTGPPGT
ncbi:MAG: hypothetical protein ACYDHB_10340 [Candidatus Dormibacteria bacterium]